jgi:hypothetical protein
MRKCAPPFLGNVKAPGSPITFTFSEFKGILKTGTNHQEENMELHYTYWKDEGWYVGHLDDYPDYNTQGETLEEFEDMLRSLYGDIKTCDFSFIHHHGKLKIA